MELKYVIFDLDPQWNMQVEELAAECEKEGVICGKLCADGTLVVDKSGRDGMGLWKDNILANRASADMDRIQVMDQNMLENAVLLTDNRNNAEKYRDKAVCIGCDREGTAFFDGAVLVTDDLTMLDSQVLEELFLRTKGLPVTIAVTDRLVIREMTEADSDELYQISRQAGMEYAFSGDSDKENIFEKERLSAYISQVYRFYGYGLWSVWKKDGTLIGCCGLSDFEMEFDKSELFLKAGVVEKGVDKAKLQNIIEGLELKKRVEGLELQYMLAEAHQGYGYAQEMCRAALRFAFARTDWDEIWIRTNEENVRSRKLALKLGFCEMGKNEKGIVFCKKEMLSVD